ncbi:MAG: pyridoxal kinase, partial [Aeromonas sp.]
TNASVDAVLQETWRQQAYELQLIAAQAFFAQPNIEARAVKLF